MRCYYDQQVFMLQARGGVSRYFFEIIRRLGDNGSFRPTLYAGFYKSQLPLHTLRGCRILGVRRFKVGPLWPLIMRAVEGTNRLLLRTLAPAIYHPTYYRAEARHAGARMVVTVYDMIHEKFPSFYPADETAQLKRAACAAADAIICISESTRRDLLNFYPELASKTSVVYLAATPDFGCGEAAPARTASGSPYALFVGERRDYKGFDLALDAWQMLGSTLPDLRLVCVGGGKFTGLELAEIQRRSLNARVSQQVATDAELAELYRKAEVFVYPSRYEGFGLPVLEAMSCGCPVVCSRSSSLPEVGGSAAEYFEPGDAGGLAAKVAGIVGNSAHRDRLIQAGHEQRQRFSWEKCALETAAVYRRCVDASSELLTGSNPS